MWLRDYMFVSGSENGKIILSLYILRQQINKCYFSYVMPRYTKQNICQRKLIYLDKYPREIIWKTTHIFNICYV